MTTWRSTAVWLVLGLAVLAPFGAAGPASAEAARHAAAAADQTVLAEIMLARIGFSPGVIDGREGDNYDNALHAFQQANGLRPGRLDGETWTRLTQLSGGAVLAAYTIRPEDVAGPFVGDIPHDFRQMAALPRLGYHTPRELLAEKFHMSETLLAALNRGKPLGRAGTVITVANIEGSGRDAVPGAASGEGVGSSLPPGAGRAATPSAARVVVDKCQHAVLAYDADNRLLAFYPASIGSAEKPAPSGTFEVRTVSRDPSYTYNPAYAFKGQTARQPVKVAPGPNNPVGVVWIGLSLPGYGIHGTPEPDNIGKTQSHGCVRLTNWDALGLARLVKKGTPVEFVG